MEILSPNQYSEYEDFVSNHPNGSITQSTYWHGVKNNWDHEIVVARDSENNITAGISVLIRSLPVIGTTMMYAPRGPVCDYSKPDQLKELQAGIDKLAKKHNAHVFKMDPDIVVEKGESFLSDVENMGYSRLYGPTGFEHIQTRFNYRIYIDGRDEEQLLMDLHSKTRYNIRLSGRRGVTVEHVGKEGLDDFMRLMTTTGNREDFSVRSKEYFANMPDSLEEHGRLYLAYYEGEAIAGAIASNYAGKTLYMYGASDNRHRNTMSTYLIQWEMIRWALETNCKIYDMMGISGDIENKDNPLYGLFRFKDGFNGQVDELIGELDYVYKPFINRIADLGISLNDWKNARARKKAENE